METLVLVHGFFGGGAQWADQKTEFSKYFRVVTPDLPGFGANHHSEAPDRIGGFAEFVLQHLTDLGIDRFHLLGHSMGGMIVQEMAARMPDRIGKLVLYGTGPQGSMPGRFEPISESKRRALADGPKATGRRIAATWFLDGESAEGYELCAEIADQASAQAVIAALSAMEVWSGAGALPGIKSPTLVLWGEADRAYLWPQPERLWNEIPGAHLAVLPGCSHAVHLEKPYLFNAILKDFLLPGNFDTR